MSKQPRIISLLASATEILHALNLGQYLVGRSHECDFPACVLSLPACSLPAIPVDGDSVEIDRLVKRQLSQALSIYRLDSELMASLQPTHILTQTQCKVCAVSLEDVERALRDQMGCKATIISLEPFSLQDVFDEVRRVASAFQRSERAEILIADFKQRVSAVIAPERPRVAALEWLQPLMAAGNWVPELIELAGGMNCFGTAGQHSPWMTWDNLLEADPDIIIAMPCGFDLLRTRSEMHWLTRQPEWPLLKAARKNQVFVCDGNQYMNRPGPRLVQSSQILREIIHSELYPPANKGSAWDVFTR